MTHHIPEVWHHGNHHSWNHASKPVAPLVSTIPDVPICKSHSVTIYRAHLWSRQPNTYGLQLPTHIKLYMLTHVIAVKKSLSGLHTTPKSAKIWHFNWLFLSFISATVLMFQSTISPNGTLSLQLIYLGKLIN